MESIKDVERPDGGASKLDIDCNLYRTQSECNQWSNGQRGLARCCGDVSPGAGDEGTAVREFMHFNKLQNSEMQNHFFSLENLVRILIPSVFAILFDEIAEINEFLLFIVSHRRADLI